MLRFEVSEAGQGTLPAIDIADEPIVIGSGAAARLRLPIQAARESHVRIEGGKWIAIGDVIVDGKLCKSGDGGTLRDITVFELGTYRLRVSTAPDGAPPSPPQRTESICRELVRAMLGAGAAPTFEIEQGPSVGATRPLAPPDSLLVIGRGDEADWVILDEDLSRKHAEVRRGWDGVTLVDLGSKNGTRVDGKPAATNTPLRDGAAIALGNVVLRFRDPAERHLSGEPIRQGTPIEVTPPPTAEPPSSPVAPRPTPWPLFVAIGIAALAAIGLAYLVAT